MYKSLFRAARKGHVKLFQDKHLGAYLKRKNAQGKWIFYIQLPANFDLRKVS